MPRHCRYLSLVYLCSVLAYYLYVSFSLLLFHVILVKYQYSYSYLDSNISHRFEQAKSNPKQWELLLHYKNQYKMPHNARPDWFIRHENGTWWRKPSFFHELFAIVCDYCRSITKFFDKFKYRLQPTGQPENYF